MKEFLVAFALGTIALLANATRAQEPLAGGEQAAPATQPPAAARSRAPPPVKATLKRAGTANPGKPLVFGPAAEKPASR
ncbi:MAG: hypothetical protein EXR36_12110 [Betaproteobacteria bacterium]|nr:hypothetical protein [Betaproteobacteria bacterium]